MPRSVLTQIPVSGKSGAELTSDAEHCLEFAFRVEPGLRGRRGIGRAIAMGLAEAGGTIGLVARSGRELAETARHVHDLGATPLVISSDLRDPGQLPELVQRVRDDLGTVGILVNNAGVV